MFYWTCSVQEVVVQPGRFQRCFGSTDVRRHESCHVIEAAGSGHEVHATVANMAGRTQLGGFHLAFTISPLSVRPFLLVSSLFVWGIKCHVPTDKLLSIHVAPRRTDRLVSPLRRHVARVARVGRLWVFDVFDTSYGLAGPGSFGLGSGGGGPWRRRRVLGRLMESR